MSQCEQRECNNADCLSTVRVVDAVDMAAASVGILFWLGYLVVYVPARLGYDLVRQLIR